MAGIRWADPKALRQLCRHCEEPAVGSVDEDPLCSKHLVEAAVDECAAIMERRLLDWEGWRGPGAPPVDRLWSA